MKHKKKSAKNSNIKIKDSTIKGILTTIIVASLGIIFVISYNSILEPAYVSYLADCKIAANESLPGGYVRGGYFEVSSNANVSIQINTCVSDEEQNDLLRHELCHLAQYKEHQNFGCAFPIGVYFNEAEAYFAQEYEWYKC